MIEDGENHQVPPTLSGLAAPTGSGLLKPEIPGAKTKSFIIHGRSLFFLFLLRTFTVLFARSGS